MRLLGCDEKYTNGVASDLECLSEWLSARRLTVGNETAENAEKRICELLNIDGIEGYTADALWQKYNARYYGEEYENSVEKRNHIFSGYKKINCVEKNNNICDIADTADMLNGLPDSFEKIRDIIEKSNVTEIKSKLYGNDFDRPDRYAADLAVKKIFNGEKCNIIEKNILFSQIICELAYKIKSGFLQLYLYPCDGLRSSAELVKYLVSRRLRVRIYLCVEADADEREIKAVCLDSGNRCFVTPMLLPCDERKKNDFCNRLSPIYPIGLLECL